MAYELIGKEGPYYTKGETDVKIAAEVTRATDAEDEIRDDLESGLATEKSERQTADTALQAQIDAQEAKSDVVDVVGTYAQLQAYDTSKLTAEDVIKVLSDSTHNDAEAFYRWHDGAWVWIGGRAASYTKAEVDVKVSTLQGEIDENASKITQVSDNMLGKLNKNQGKANAGKFLKVGPDGTVSPAEDNVGLVAVAHDNTISGDGTSGSPLSIAESLSTKADAATALNYNNITNCITEIPQDIKLEINSDGALVLKAGSKIYIPNGFEADGTTRKFDVVTINNDLTSNQTLWGAQQYYVICSGTSIGFCAVGATTSALNAPTPANGAWCYILNDNKIKRADGSAWNDSGFALPIGLATSTNGTTVSTIDKVFNGLGYIGSTPFALPGSKGLIPNYRNADGSLKNIEVTVDKVLISIDFIAQGPRCALCIRAADGKAVEIFSSPIRVYNEDLNVVYNTQTRAIENDRFIAGYLNKGINGAVSNFTPKTAFHAVDYNDAEFIAHQAMPSNKYVNLTLPSHGATLTAPADGYIAMAISTGTANLTIGLMNITAGGLSVIIPMAGSGGYSVFCPVSKNDVVRVYHYNTTPDTFRLVTTNGIK